MSGAAAVAEVRSAQAQRREHILDAAEACFVRNGFHRTTMQDLAREAGMSPGNIYRYFESKEAVVRGLAERDRERGMALVEEFERAGDRRGALLRIIEHYFAHMTREDAVLRVDLWSEATRNPDIAALVKQGEDEARCWMTEIFAALAATPDCDPVALHAQLDAQMKGIVVARALNPDYDPAPAAARLSALMDAGLEGRLATIARPLGETVS
ncbi:TetR/AcrR family transcriptional regulator [Methylobacterium radiodurans]|uniref:TetR/AcrR family transcriptional regulator n=1 Tax=Methylobacterium radiodurans TaxID=2202828 RepID=UPI001FE24513|nr:TetR/AcrR family transcriptional regulator [Methylobacterium radiodurans]